MPESAVNNQSYYYGETAFTNLMHTRIRKVLVICSQYDFFMLEEDGRIEEQVFNEYVSLNITNPPIFIHADSAKKAFEILSVEKIDLIIEMLSIGDEDPFLLARKIKNSFSEISIVVLTPFSREVSLRLVKEDLSAIDHVFCWLGNAHLLLAIIKLIEDSMNAEKDILSTGVQAILLVEDSVRYNSIYLPALYRIILEQSKEFAREALNEHQQMLRRRGRPKILLAHNLNEAATLYNKFKGHILGIISDVSYKESPTSRDTKTKAGIEFCRMVKEEDPNLPVLLQSSDLSNREEANTLGASFLAKKSKNLDKELREIILQNFGFGEFVFRDPQTQEPYCIIKDLKSLQEIILKIPDNILEYHTRHDDLSKWLNARALFPIAKRFKKWNFDDFRSPSDVKNFIYQAISSFRISKSRGIIAEFDPVRFDDYLFFSRVGDGSLGGKARGLAFMDMILKESRLNEKYPDINICVPPSVVICTDIFEQFMQSNRLFELASSQWSDEDILSRFIKAELDPKTRSCIQTIARIARNPVAVRSSSKLEDSFYQPFAGVYNTYMIPPHPYPAKMAEMIELAIKSVYASVMFRSSKLYLAATSNLIDEEEMGIIIQPVCGNNYNGLFYPSLSGVARSLNYYPIGPEKLIDGIVNLAYGLGKYIAEGGTTLRFSPKYPHKIIQLSNPQMALTDTQKHFYALEMDVDKFHSSIDDKVNLRQISLRDADTNKSFRSAVSTYDLNNQTIRDGMNGEGKPVITFANILNHDSFPLAGILDDLLEISASALNNPVEIEFAANLDPQNSELALFNFLQVRPIVANVNNIEVDLDNLSKDEVLIYSERAMGNGSIENIKDIIYIKTEKFSPSNNRLIANEIEHINKKLSIENRNYILMGPGRWGSADPCLGIPVKWAQISNARLIVESGLENYRIDPSQGTHFFHNLTSFSVGYFTINTHLNDGFIHMEYLNSLSADSEMDYIRHIKLDKSLSVLIDGKTAKGVVIIT
jgi:hypothetical protein